jgi:cytochrome c oxidase subunit 1
MPRRYGTYAPEYQVLHVLSTAGASIMSLGFILPFFDLIWALKNGPVAGPNPFRATGLEWQTTSPPPTFNFDRTPIVTTGPYAYSPEADELDDAQADLERARLEVELTRARIEADHQPK